MGVAFISSSPVQRTILKAMFYMNIAVSLIGLVTPGIPPYIFKFLSTYLPMPLTFTDESHGLNLPYQAKERANKAASTPVCYYCR
jgi:hypothetical protein